LPSSHRLSYWKGDNGACLLIFELEDLDPPDGIIYLIVLGPNDVPKPGYFSLPLYRLLL
jgi:hypothetical protein